MGTIVPRKRQDGSTGYTAQIVKKKGGKVVWREAQTFDRKQVAQAWLKKRESELDQPGGIERAKAKGTLAEAIDRYVSASRKEIGKTKSQVLDAIKNFDIASKDCSDIRSEDIVSLAEELSKGRQPQTVGNYISHLSAVFDIARPAWGFGLDQAAMEDAQTVLRKMGLIAKSNQRDRRPTLAELDLIMAHFIERSERRPSSAPMHRITAFAIFSTRRQEELSILARKDLDIEGKRILVRDMKHPGQKIGNNVWVELPDEALAIIQAMPKTEGRLFPYLASGISAAFTRACQFLEIEDLHFHDLRHEGVSRLFELGRTIPQAASVSGHRSWSSLQRYTHLRQTGDKYKDWKWLEIVTKPA